MLLIWGFYNEPNAMAKVFHIRHWLLWGQSSGVAAGRVRGPIFFAFYFSRLSVSSSQ